METKDLNLIIQLLEKTKEVSITKKEIIIDFTFENEKLSIYITPEQKTKDEYILQLQSKINSLAIKLDSNIDSQIRWVDCGKELPYLMDNYLVLMQKPNSKELISFYAKYHPKDRCFSSIQEFKDECDIEDCTPIKWLDERKRQNGIKTDFEDWNTKFR